MALRSLAARPLHTKPLPAIIILTKQSVLNPQRRHSSSSSKMPSRALHSSSNRPSATDNLPVTFDDLPSQTTPQQPPLSVLPLTTVLRTLVTTTISSSPILLPPSLAAMSLLANTHNPLLNPDKNPLLRWFLKKTFYAQFCAGENAVEVKRTIAGLKNLGFEGVILGYAREVVLSETEQKQLSSAAAADEIGPWMAGTLETVALAERGDFVAVKFTGAGRQALWRLSERMPPGEALGSAMERICELARERGVRLLFDAEQTAVQAGIDMWTVECMRRWNREGATVYGTYQAYLRRTPEVLRGHLEMAAREGWVVGVKLVRGAYLGSDPREVIWRTKGETDEAYDGIAGAVMRRTWGGVLQGTGEFPRVEMVLATHNAESVRKGREILEKGEGRADVAFAQLQGMADEVSCELVAGKGEKRQKAYKYLVWGSTGECMKYLLRRAHENRDAVQRTKSGRDAMRGEVVRRVKALFGLS